MRHLVDILGCSENLTRNCRLHRDPERVSSTEENFMAAVLKNKALLALISAFAVLMIVGIMTS